MIPPSKAPGQMSEPFDPYRKWLGIPPKDQPPNHYRLLGIAPLEQDPDVIENAAARQMAHVRTFKTSKHAALSQRLLTELSSAKLCLLTPEHKQAYDAQLRAQLAAAGKLSDSMVLSGVPPIEAAAPPLAEPRSDDRWRTDEEAPALSLGPPPVPIPMPVGTAVPSVPVIRRSSAASLRARRDRSTLPLAITIISLVILGGVVGVAALLFSGVLDKAGGPQRGKPEDGKSVDKAPPARGEKTSPASPAATGEQPEATGELPSEATAFPVGDASATSSPPALPAASSARPMPAEGTAAMPAIDRVRQALFQAQQALQARDDQSCLQHLAAAEQGLAAGQIDEGERARLREQLQHLQNLRKLVDQFWTTVSDNVQNKFQVGEKFSFFNSELTLVSRGAEGVEISFHGQTRHSPVRELDPRAAALIAARTVKLPEPATLLPILAFLSIDGRAERECADDQVVQFARKFFRENKLAGDKNLELLAALGVKLAAELPLDASGAPLPKNERPPGS